MAIGGAAFIVCIASLAASLFGFGVSSGATLMFGRTADRDRGSLRAFFMTGLALSVSITAAVAIIVPLLGSFFGLARLDTIFVSTLIALGSWPLILQTLYQSTLRIGAIALAAILSSVLRLAVGLPLLYSGWGFMDQLNAFFESFKDPEDKDWR